MHVALYDNLPFDKMYSGFSLTQLNFLVPSLALLFAIYIIYASSVKQDSKEPPYVYSRVPFIGHIIGMIRYGAKYFDIVKYVHII